MLWPKAHPFSCAPAGIFREIVISRKGAFSCPVASGIIFAVNADVPGDAGAPLEAYCQGLLASMQARQPCWSGKQQGAHYGNWKHLIKADGTCLVDNIR